MVVNIKITDPVKDILKIYDADDLLRTIPYDYKQPDRNTLKLYSDKVKSTTPTDITLTEQIYDWLTAIAQNTNAPLSLIFNFLIETAANCGKIHTKNIKRALDCYYDAVNNNKPLFLEILSKYADSAFYNKERGLSEEDVAYFLAISDERTSYCAGVPK